MPRVNNAHIKDTDVSNANVATKVRKNAIKTEVVCPGEQHVFHRKSERRRVARDIFLVFEEQPCRRVRGGASKKKTAQKPKFGHLMVDDPNRTKGLLRDIKNEPKCYLTEECTTTTATTITTPKEKKKTSKANSRIASKSLVAVEKQSQPTNEDTIIDPVARVNPIFLWVKQDDTRIVEVRCEDYDKRNRIRITKTTNGWRAIPRTDPTTSKIVKILQTPLLKVKREIYENNLIQKYHESFCASTVDEVTEVIEKQSFSADPANGDVPISTVNSMASMLISDIPDKIGVTDANMKNISKQPKIKKEVKKPRKTSKMEIQKTEMFQQPMEPNISELHFETPLVNCGVESETPIELLLQSNLGSMQTVKEINVEADNVNRFDNTVKDQAEVTDVREKIQRPPTEIVTESEAATTTNTAEKNPELNEKEIDTETYHHHSPHLQLCPRTGLFLPTVIGESDADVDADVIAVAVDCADAFNTNFLSKDILVDLANCDDICGSKLQTTGAQLVANLDADTKNLKDLLDDADLMQHCSDNANSDADIIDSIVKRSCENNLIQETDILKNSVAPTTFITTQSEDNRKDLISAAIPHHIVDPAVRDSPKCLSFNEAGEIEGLNGELFQSNTFMDTYEKESSVEAVHLDDGKKTENEELTTLSSPLALKDKLTDDVILEESPKDLSYKKREEVCPPSESRSQCAVTSSSDIVKSPQQGELPTIETTSEAIKNLILEQFIKLNALNVIPNPMTKQQSEPIDLGTSQRDMTIGNECNNYTPSTNYIETVVIDDNSDEEPMKKRIRNTVKHSKNNLIEETSTQTTTQTTTLIDKDPDPLTQLQLLIRNTQWKVPDPILVPKDRLRAVLASPAREIPLLITTRPELRLPEAFAYPEIIQNPNILVISMAQLEAILKNEMDVEKSKRQCAAPAPINEMPIENANKLNTVQCMNGNKQPNEPKNVKVKEPTLNTATVPPKCTHVEANLASDINTATLAVLNQMLWLPYFGQLSQEFLKTIKGPLGVPNKYAGMLPPLYNHHLGLQHLDEIYKNYLKQMSALKHLSAEASVNNAMPNFPLPLGAFQQSMEATVFQKMLQHHFLNMNPLVAAAEIPTQRGIVRKSPARNVTPNVEHMLPVEEKKAKSSTTTTMTNTTTDLSGMVPDVTEKLHRPNNNSNNNNVTISCDNVSAENANFNKYTYVHKQELDNKPRLTCKSLSNLLEPESVPLSPVVPLVNLSTDHIRNATHEHACSNNQMNSISSKDTAVHAAVEHMPFKTAKPNRVSNHSLHVSHEQAKYRKRALNYTETISAVAPTIVAATASTVDQQHTSRNIVAENINAEANQALWHPLFGSNAKTGYSSPWQWTTVTATGE